MCRICRPVQRIGMSQSAVLRLSFIPRVLFKSRRTPPNHSRHALVMTLSPAHGCARRAATSTCNSSTLAPLTVSHFPGTRVAFFFWGGDLVELISTQVRIVTRTFVLVKFRGPKNQKPKVIKGTEVEYFVQNR